MSEISELANAIKSGEMFSESRAILDYSCQTKTTKEWIVSHEIIRRRLSAASREREALQKQINVLNDRLLKSSQVEEVGAKL